MTQTQFTKTFHEITPTPKSVLILLLEGKKDEEIAAEIGASAATVRKHIQNLCDRFKIPSQVAGIKKNRRQELIALAAQYLPDLVKDRAVALKQQRSPLTPLPSPVTPSAKAETSKQTQDWGGAPDASVFYGRTEELSQLKTWILDDSCRLVALLGMAGIGKTTLSVKLAQEIEGKFDCVIWRSLRNAPPVEKLLADLLQVLSRRSQPDKSGRVDELISQLMEHLRASRCLLVVDDFDRILKSGDFVGHYQEGYKAYGQLLKRVGEEPHQSCLLLSSLEKPREIALLEGETLPVRSLPLSGLGKAAREILKAKGLSGEDNWEILIKLYRGNPLALKMVASTIQELFGGSVADFLEMSLTGIVQDIIFLIGQQFNRLSPLEKDIMYWLAIEQEPITLIKLRTCLAVSELQLFTALKSLGERSLIEKGSGQFSLQPAVIEYVRNKFVKQICQEIDEFIKTQDLSALKLFKSHALVKLTDKDGVQEDQASPILISFKERLLTARDSGIQTNITEQLEQIIATLPDNSQRDVVYAKTYLENLLIELKGN